MLEKVLTWLVRDIPETPRNHAVLKYNQEKSKAGVWHVVHFPDSSLVKILEEMPVESSGYRYVVIAPNGKNYGGRVSWTGALVSGLDFGSVAKIYEAAANLRNHEGSIMRRISSISTETRSTSWGPKGFVPF